MNHSEFFDFLKKWRALEKYPPTSAWPKTISLGNADFWNNIQRMQKRTLADSLEYESSFFYVEGNVFASEPFKGDENSVMASHGLRVEYEKAYGKYYNRKTIIDEKLVKTEQLKLAQIPKELKLGFFFNVHTHPVHYLNVEIPEASGASEANGANGASDKIKTYGFFSDTDINSLLFSRELITCLVTDELWIAAKTDKVISTIGTVGVEMLQRISDQAYSGDKYLEDIIKAEMKDWGLVFYRGRFNAQLERIL